MKRRPSSLAVALLAAAAATQQLLTTVDPLLSAQWHLKDRTIEPAGANLVAAWASARGAGVVVGIVDDGLQHAHPDLLGNFVADYSYDFLDDDADPDPGTNRHGTAVAGVAAAVGDNGLGGSGAAPAASLAGLRILGQPASDADIAAALAHEPDRVHLLNNSWGPSDSGLTISGPGPLTTAAIESAATHGRGGLGRVFVWSAGNGRFSYDNCNFDGYANNRHVVSVGSVGDNGRFAFYSEPCSALFVSAPSSGGRRFVTTTDLMGPVGYALGDYTNTFGGTSAAAAVVSGMVALMLSENPGLTSRDVQHILARTSVKIDPADSSWTSGSAFPHSENYGFGLVDGAAAVSLARQWNNVPPESATPLMTRQVERAIPDATASGVTDTVVLDAGFADFTIERVEVGLSASHTRRGDLEVRLQSPAGVVSHLTTPRLLDDRADLGWRFSSVRHWGESAAGTWRLTVVDTRSSGTGTLHGWTLRMFGTRDCAYTLSPREAAFDASGGVGQVTVTAGVGCAWTASSSAPWLTIQSGESGSGDGEITYSVAANPTTSVRQATVHAMEQAHTVTQAGRPGNDVRVTSPVAGEILYTGTPYVIAWSSEDVTTSSFDVSFTADGATFFPVEGCTALPATARTCVWVAPGPPATAARLLIETVDANGNRTSSAPSGPFTVSPGTASIQVTAPGPGEDWGMGSTHTIRWSHNLGPKSRVRIEVSRGSKNWRTIAAAVPNESGSGHYDWSVTGPASPLTLIRVSWLSGFASAISTSPLRVAPPFIRVESPGRDGLWSIGSRQSIAWSHNLGSQATFHVDVTRGEGARWTEIGVAGASGENRGALAWSVTAPETRHGRVRVTWLQVSRVRDYSAFFTIAPAASARWPVEASVPVVATATPVQGHLDARSITTLAVPPGEGGAQDVVVLR